VRPVPVERRQARDETAVDQQPPAQDRKLQPAPQVFCHYFVHLQRPEDRVLKVLVSKTERILAQLGSLSQVLDARIEKTLAEHKVGGKQTWSDSRVRQHYARERLVGKDVLHKSRQATDRQTGKKKVIYLPKSEWIWRDVPHLRILTDELASAVLEKLGRGADSFGRKAKNRQSKAHRVDLYPKVLVRPICGGCGNPMILGRSDDKYQSFFCFNANSGIQGCTNRGYKSGTFDGRPVVISADDAGLVLDVSTLYSGWRLRRYGNSALPLLQGLNALHVPLTIRVAGVSVPLLPKSGLLVRLFAPAIANG
jgi:hypothetical protein